MFSDQEHEVINLFIQKISMMLQDYHVVMYVCCNIIFSLFNESIYEIPCFELLRYISSFMSSPTFFGPP